MNVNSRGWQSSTTTPSLFILARIPPPTLSGRDNRVIPAPTINDLLFFSSLYSRILQAAVANTTTQKTSSVYHPHRISKSNHQ